jgi:hypothetical protein
MTILLITHSQDNESISMVSQAIADQEGKVFRFDTDRFPTETQLEIYYGRGVERKMLIAAEGALDLKLTQSKSNGPLLRLATRACVAAVGGSAEIC